jgi:hypothetical protein
MVICDPGGEVYTARTFGARRYDSAVLSSYGHAVPVIAGRYSAGRRGGSCRIRADFREEEDTLVLDLRSAYPVTERAPATNVPVRDGTRAPTVRDDVLQEPRSFERSHHLR